MNKLLIILIIFFTLLNFSFRYEAKDIRAQETLEPMIVEEIGYAEVDTRIQILSDYLSEYASPLQYHASDFVEAADRYGVDWKLVPSIAGVESTFGKHIPGGYNAWGWGVYGTQTIYFKSWRDGIFTVTEGLKKNYIDRGLTNPLRMNRMYAASPSWGWRVDYFMKDMDKFAKSDQYEYSNHITLGPKIAQASAKLKEEDFLYIGKIIAVNQ